MLHGRVFKVSSMFQGEHNTPWEQVRYSSCASPNLAPKIQNKYLQVILVTHIQGRGTVGARIGASPAIYRISDNLTTGLWHVKFKVKIHTHCFQSLLYIIFIIFTCSPTRRSDPASPPLTGGNKRCRIECNKVRERIEPNVFYS